VRREKAEARGIILRGFRSEVCPKGHLKLGSNIYVRPSGYRVCRTCARVTAKLRMRRKRGFQGRVYKERKEGAQGE
jgi:hypothetical protein